MRRLFFLAVSAVAVSVIVCPTITKGQDTIRAEVTYMVFKPEEGLVNSDSGEEGDYRFKWLSWEENTPQGDDIRVDEIVYYNNILKSWVNIWKHFYPSVIRSITINVYGDDPYLSRIKNLVVYIEESPNVKHPTKKVRKKYYIFHFMLLTTYEDEILAEEWRIVESE